MLVVNLAPEQSESIMGYILRLTEANGYPSTTYILASFRRRPYQSSIGRLDANHIASITGICRKGIDKLTLIPSHRPRAYIRIYGNDLPCYEVHLSQPKVCHLCLSEGRHCEAFWDLAQAVICPIHRIRLSTHCDSCGKKISWFRAHIRQCKCGAYFKSSDVSKPSYELCELMELLRCKVYQDECIATFPDTMNHLAHLSLRRVLKLIWVISGVLQSKDFRRAPKCRSHYHQHLERVALALSNWPFGFRDFLNSIFTDVIENSNNLPHFRKLFSWLFVRLIKNDMDDGSCYSFLEREVYAFGVKYWTRDAMSRDINSQKLMPLQMRWGTLSEAMSISGIHWATLRKRIASGDVKVRRINNNTNRGTIIDLDSIRIKSQTKYPSISLRKAAPMIGVSIHTLRELRKSGIYDEKYRCSFPTTYAKEDVDAFSNKLRQIGYAKRVVSDVGVSTLKAEFNSWCASPEEKAGLIAILLANPSLVVGKKRGGNVDSFQVQKKTTETYFRNARAANPKCESGATASIRLGCPISVVKALVKYGYIATHHINGRHVPCSASVSEFSEKYIPMSRLAKRVGVSHKYAYARLDFSKIEHIKVKSLQFSTIFFCRSEIPKIEMMFKLMQ